jgi:hypothetical protein
MKAILEMDMPESCGECVLSALKHEGHSTYWVCGGLTVKTKVEYGNRHRDCPLKPVTDRCEKAEKINGKCRGYQKSRWNDEPAELCKECTEFALFESGDDYD